MPLVDLSPALRLLGMAALLALLPLVIWWWRHRHAGGAARRTALTVLTLFLTFDLVVFGAFTRLTDSGLGCPDWPGCYGHASPLAAQAHIDAAETALPSGPVTTRKAWIEMIHRYLAMTVGALILVLAALSLRARRELPFSLAWPLATLVWVVVQGLFGKYTVTLKLYPAIVTLHLLGGLILLALLAYQAGRYAPPRPALAAPLRRLLWLAGGLLLAQIALGGWVSTNYAVLACRGFPQCNGQWWPAGMDFEQGFTVLRELGRAADGDFLPAAALLAIHWTHRLGALVLLLALAALALGLWRAGQPRPVVALALLLCLQVGSGAANVVLHWPLLAALLHTAGAAGLVLWWVGLALRDGSLAVPAAATASAATPAARLQPESQ